MRREIIEPPGLSSSFYQVVDSEPCQFVLALRHEEPGKVVISSSKISADCPEFAAGEPGDPKKPARTIKVVMRDDRKKMAFEPARITVRQGEHILFVVENDGTDDHEFVLATAAENRKHAELMKKFPDMEHDDPNAKRLAVVEHGEILWKFTKAGTFEFACLIPR